MKFITKHKITGDILFESDSETLSAHIELGLLMDTSLLEADLRGAELRGADLRWADLRWADLRGVDLRWADLRGADLRWADLHGADLRGADLSGADLREAAIVLLGLMWNVFITSNHIRIGCESHLLEDWESFDDKRINNMNSKALEFWKEYKDFLIKECKKITKDEVK